MDQEVQKRIAVEKSMLSDTRTELRVRAHMEGHSILGVTSEEAHQCFGTFLSQRSNEFPKTPP